MREVAATSGVAAAASGSAATGAAGAVADLIGGFSSLAAANAKSRVDTRAWDSLPDRVHVIFVPPSDVCPEITVRYLDGSDHPIPGLASRVVAPASRPASRYSYVYVPATSSGS